MKNNLRPPLALCLALLLLCQGLSAALATDTTSLDYSVAEKLLKQVEAGSGFQGTLTIQASPAPSGQPGANEAEEPEAGETEEDTLPEAGETEAPEETTAPDETATPDSGEGPDAQANAPQEVTTLDISYINVRENASAGIRAEQRLGVFSPSQQTPAAILWLALQESGLYATTTLLGEDWYRLSQAPGSQQGTEAGAANPVAQAAQEAFSQSALPGLISFFLPTALDLQGFDAASLDPYLAEYTTKMDLWIEGYRQSAELGKLEDGTGTMAVQYTIPPAAIKSQLKQLVLDLLTSPEALAELQALLPEEEASQWLDPQQQNEYFFLIDQLPLEGDLTIARTVSLKGQTLRLSMELPLYDSIAGAATLSYHREAGDGDLPDENVIALESDALHLRLAYQHYSTMTQVDVYQGTLLRQPKGEAPAGEEGPQAFACSFSLSTQQTTSVDEDNRETLTQDMTLRIAPLLTLEEADGSQRPLTQEEQAGYYPFSAFEAHLVATFASKQAKNASTSVDCTLSLSGEGWPLAWQLAFTGRSTAQWTPEAIPTAGAVEVSALSTTDQQGLLARLAYGLATLPTSQREDAASTPSPTGEEASPPPDTDPPEASPEAPEGEPTATPAQEGDGTAQ